MAAQPITPYSEELPKTVSHQPSPLHPSTPKPARTHTLPVDPFKLQCFHAPRLGARGQQPAARRPASPKRNNPPARLGALPESQTIPPRLCETCFAPESEGPAPAHLHPKRRSEQQEHPSLASVWNVSSCSAIPALNPIPRTDHTSAGSRLAAYQLPDAVPPAPSQEQTPNMDSDVPIFSAIPEAEGTAPCRARIMHQFIWCSSSCPVECGGGRVVS